MDDDNDLTYFIGLSPINNTYPDCGSSTSPVIDDIYTKAPSTDCTPWRTAHADQVCLTSVLLVNKSLEEIPASVEHDNARAPSDALRHGEATYQDRGRENPPLMPTSSSVQVSCIGSYSNSATLSSDLNKYQRLNGAIVSLDHSQWATLLLEYPRSSVGS